MLAIIYTNIKQSYLFLNEYPLRNLFPNRPHNPTPRMRTTATNPNSPNFPTGPISKKILNTNTTMKDIPLSQ